MTREISIRQLGDRTREVIEWVSAGERVIVTNRGLLADLAEVRDSVIGGP